MCIHMQSKSSNFITTMFPGNSNHYYYDFYLFHISQLKSDFEAKMVWGESQMDRGVTSKAEPCAQPGCSPFPDCCKTDNRKKPVIV